MLLAALLSLVGTDTSKIVYRVVQSRGMSTPVAENTLLAPHGTNFSVQDLAHESSPPKNADGSNLTADNPQPRTPRTESSQFPIVGQEGDEAAWGSNFWVTLVDPQVGHFSSTRKANCSLQPRPKRRFSHALRLAK